MVTTFGSLTNPKLSTANVMATLYTDGMALDSDLLQRIAEAIGIDHPRRLMFLSQLRAIGAFDAGTGALDRSVLANQTLTDQAAQAFLAEVDKQEAAKASRKPPPAKAKREYKLILPEGVMTPPTIPKDDGKGKDGADKPKGLTSSLLDPRTIGGQISTEFLAEFAADLFTRGGHSSVNRAAHSSAGGVRGLGGKIAKGAGLALMAAPVAALGIPFWNLHKRQALTKYIEEVVEDINAAMTLQNISFQEMKDVDDAYIIIWKQVLVGVGKADGKYDDQERLVDSILRTVCHVVFSEGYKRPRGTFAKKVLGEWKAGTKTFANPPRFLQFPPVISERTVAFIEESLGLNDPKDPSKPAQHSRVHPFGAITYDRPLD